MGPRSYRNACLPTLVFALLISSCGEDQFGADPWPLDESPAMRCGAGTADFERSTWEHDSDLSRLTLEKAEGCAVYRAELTFADVWTTRTEICNRCDESRHLVWSAPNTASVEGTSLGEGVDIDAYDGPDHGDGLTGFVLFTDRDGRQMLNQCQAPPPLAGGAYELYGVNVRQVLSVEMHSGLVYSSEQDFAPERFVRDYFTNNPPQPGYWGDPVDFSRLERLQYVWPRLRVDDTTITQDFPFANCAELGNGDQWLKNHPEAARGGEFETDRGFSDYLLQDFENELPAAYLDPVIENATVGGVFREDNPYSPEP